MFKIALKNVKTLLDEFKMIFIVFFIVFATMVVSLIFLHSYNLQIMEDGNRVNDELRTYGVCGNVSLKEIEEIRLWIENELDKDIIEGISIQIAEPIYIDEVPVITSAIYENVNEKKISLDRGTLEVDNGQLQIILGDFFYLSNNRTEMVNDTINIGGYEFTIKGIGYIDIDGVDAIITRKGFQELEVSAEKVDIVLRRRLNKDEVRKLREYIGNSYSVQEPVNYDKTIRRQFIIRFVMIYILVLMATINIMGFYRYVIKKRTKEFFIYLLLGMKKNKLKRMLISETVILATVGYTMGLIILGLFNGIFQRYSSIQINLEIVLKMYVIIVLCSILSLVPIFLVLNKEQSYKGYTREDGV